MLCQLLKEYRTTKKITQRELSTATGIPQTTISSWERGANVPNILDCIKLADFYGITIDELVGRELKDF